MSALDDYRNLVAFAREGDSLYIGIADADAAIAELEADRKDLMKRLWTSEEKAAGLEAELAALREQSGRWGAGGTG